MPINKNVKVVIRPADKTDLSKIEKLYNIPELAIANNTYLTADVYEGWLNKDYFIVAEHKSSIIGALLAEPLKLNGAIIWFFAVEKAFRNNKVGQTLLNRFIDNHKFNGGEWVILYAPLVNKSTQIFYEKQGFIKGKEHIEYLKLL